jgi:hypothetical protein
MSVAQALAKLEDAMRSVGGTSADPDRRRAARLLADLLQTDDAELQQFAKRQLPGRAVDDASLREARELLLGVARLIATQGSCSGASCAIATIKGDLLARLPELERAAVPSPATPLPAVTHVPAPAPVVPAPAPALPRPIPPPPEPLSALDAVSRPSPMDPATEVCLHAHGTTAATPFDKRSRGFAATAELVALDTTSMPSTAAPPLPAATPFDSRKADRPQAPRVVPSATPFDNPPPSIRAPAVEAMAPRDAGSGVNAKEEADDPLDCTISVGDGAASIRFVLPFAPRPSQGSSEDARPSAHTQAAPGADGGPVSTRLDSLPFRKSQAASSARATYPELPPHLARLDVVQHATFTALLLVYPDRHPQVYAQYGVRDGAEREALDRHWLSRVGDDTTLRARWIELRDRAIAHYCAQR